MAILNLGNSNSAFSGSFSGSFEGNGTNLNLASNTTIPAQNPFPLTASSAAIISRSFASGDTDSTALRLLGSGSVSQSGIFEVEGSAGPLFSVADGLDGVLMEVNNISGLPLFQVSSSNEVFVNRGNLTSGVTTATASFANFSGSFQGDGSNLTNLNTTTPTLQQVTTAGNSTDQGLIVSGSTIFKPLTSSPANIEFSTEAYSGRQNPTITLKNASDQKTVHIGQSENDGLFELYSSTETRVVSIQEHFQAFSPPNGLSLGYGTYFGVTSSISPSVASPDSYVKIAHDGYSGVPYSILQVNKKGTFAGYDGLSNHQNNSSGSITLQGIMNSNNNSAPTVGITSVNGNRVVNFGGPGFVNAVNVHNNYLKYGLQIGGDFTGNTSNMALTDGSLIMSGSTGGFSVKSVSSEAEIKTNDGSTTLTLGTTSSFSYVSASAFKGDGSQLTNLPPSNPFPFTGDAQITGSLLISASHTSQSLSVIGSGSTVFDVIGSEGTLLSIDDDLDGVIFTANDRSGLPALEVSASGEVYIGKSPQSLYTTAVISSTTSANSALISLSTSSYGGMFIDYTVHSGSNARAGNITWVWNDTFDTSEDYAFTHTTTTDVGNVELDFIPLSYFDKAVIFVGPLTNSSPIGYTVKAIIKAI